MTGRQDAALHGRRDACRYLALGPSIGGSVEMRPLVWRQPLHCSNAHIAAPGMGALRGLGNEGTVNLRSGRIGRKSGQIRDEFGEHFGQRRTRLLNLGRFPLISIDGQGAACGIRF